mgnify:CR=1 FL=1
MPSRGLKVIKPGLLTLVQDLGRFGYQHLGLSPGGAADEQAFLWANRLVGNPPNSPTLEICLGGLELKAQTDCQLALTGADLGVRHQGRPVRPWQTLSLSAGEHLTFGYPKMGLRAYLAVTGGFEITPSFGSVASVVREQLGGLDGRGGPLKEGDNLPCPGSTGGRHRQVPLRFLPDYTDPLTLKVIEGDLNSVLSSKQQADFYHQGYRIQPQSDRMAVRLEGKPLRPKTAGMVSEGISFGCIQVPPEGQPIVLLKDRQTLGGYPKLGTVFELDAFALAQRQAPTQVRFSPIPLDEAQAQLRRFYRFFGFR